MGKNHFKKQIEESLNEKVIKLTALSEQADATQFIAQTETKKYFVKTSYEPTNTFQFEATGLKILSQHYAHVPLIYSFSLNELIIEFIESEAPQDSFWIQLANNLAQLHNEKKPFYGFFENNKIGLSAQQNLAQLKAKDSWALFFWNHRIEHKLNQVQEVRKYEFDNNLILKLKKTILKKLENFKSEPTLIHGDLWIGNIVCGINQTPYLIDPAVSFSDREADLAMTECFGGFPPLFYSTYKNAFPLQKGYEDRKHIYNLFHILNHYVIFGDSYKQSCLEIMDLIIKNEN